DKKHKKHKKKKTDSCEECPTEPEPCPTSSCDNDDGAKKKHKKKKSGHKKSCEPCCTPVFTTHIFTEASSVVNTPGGCVCVTSSSC
ncbi:hypothetical protein GGH13_008867, partial [Coemansia sp. S155-1]